MLLTLVGEALADPPIPLLPGNTDTATLRYRYQPGETVSYRFTLDEQVRLSDISTTRRLDLSVSGSLQLALVVQRVDEGGDAVLTEEVREPAFDVDADGFNLSSRTITRAISGVIRTIELSPRGELVDEEGQAGSTNETLQVLGVDFARLGEALRLELPEDPVEVGETWRIESSSPGNGTAFDRRESISLTFLGWADVGSRRCAVLEVGGDAWRELAAGVALGAVSGPALTRGVYDGYVYFDPEAGRVVRGEVGLGTVGQVNTSTAPLDLTDQARWTFELVQ